MSYSFWLSFQNVVDFREASMPIENRKSIYLSGPMTGLPDLNFPAFDAMTASLRADGHVVTNPAEINPDGGTWNDCTRRDIAAAMYCDTMAALPAESIQGRPPRSIDADCLGMTVVNAHDLVSMEIADN
jgi:hypothetical protein